MVRVCKKLFPKGKFPYQKKEGYFMHDILKQQLDVYLKNVRDDWDFVIIISGEGEVRVGKSVLAQQIGQYWTQQINEKYNLDIPFNLKDNIVFNGADLIKKGNELGVKHPYSCLIFDEAGADLEGIKAMRYTTQAVRDFLRECGQYNLLTILVLPEYFDLPKGIALSRSSCLINVYWIGDNEGRMNRGFFKYYSRPNKKNLYLRGKKDLNYNAWKQDFFGNFDNVFTLPEKEYRELKRKALKSREKMSSKELRWREWLRAAVLLLVDVFNLSYRELADKMNEVGKVRISHMAIGRIINREKEEEEE
jgi:hypothetical protein